MRFRCLSLRKRLFIAVAPGLILLAVVVALAYQGFQSISHSTSMLVDRQARQAFLAERANEHTLQAAHHLLRLLLTQERKSRVPLYAAMDAALNTADQALLQLVNAEGESATANISRLQTLRQAYGVAFQETVEQIELGGPISAIHHFERQTEPLLRELLSATAEFSTAQQDAMQSEVDRLTAEAARDQANIIAIGLLALLLGALVSGLLATGIARPVNQAAEIAEKIAGGDYSIPIAAPGHDELSSMLRAIDTMRLRIGEREAHIRRIAYVDELTDLANRARFVEDFATRHWRGGAMLILDIDRFTMINQALGHAIGDELLRAVARRLQAVLAEHDLLARLWGDEFAMLLCGADIDSAMATANRIRDVLREPIEIAGQSIDLDASIGVVRIPQGDIDLTPLMRQADLALRQAKQLHAGVALARDEVKPPSHEQLSLIGDMRNALMQGQFLPYYQPKADLQTGRIVGAEALIRWQHPERGLVPPGKFIPFAEQTGFIREITTWLVRRVIKDAAHWHREGRGLVISANISTLDLLNPALSEIIIKELEQSGLPAQALCLEITESALMHDPAQALAALNRLAAYGILISIDDYGSGQASLAYVRDLPVNELKIDREFVSGVDHAPRNAAIVRSTLLLCRELQLKVVAEGAERAEEVAWLRANRCDIVQGYVIAKPLPKTDFEQLLAKPPGHGESTDGRRQDSLPELRRPLPNA